MIYFSESEPMYANVIVRARGNLSADEINELVAEVENEILDVNGIKSLNAATTLPGQPSRDSAIDAVGTLYLELHEEGDKSVSGTEIFEEIRERTSKLAGIEIEIKKMEMGPC